MTNGEKFKEVFGFEVNKPTVNYGMYCPHGRKDMNDRAVECLTCNRDCISDFWQSEYKIFESVGIAIDNMIDEIQHWESDDTQDDYQRGAMDMQKYVLRVIDKYTKELMK